MDLKKIAQEIREALEKRRQELELTFIEDEHIYYMKDLDGKIKSNFPSVSKVIKKFYIPFDAESKAYDMTDGDESEAQRLLEKWKAAGDYSTNLGSRVHYVLESDLVQQYNNYKDVRQPIFECDNSQIDKSNQMIYGGKKFLDLMHERGAVLLDTEIVLGDPEFGYTGQPDKVWLMMNKQKDSFGLVVTDWKTNQEKNFKIQPYTGKMLHPFENFYDTALTHYYIQLPLYGKLLLKMLENTKFKDIKMLGCVITHLKDTGEYVEYKVPNEINQGILQMDIKSYLK
jgi:hypothetical protein